MVGTVSLILADVLVLSTYINPLFVHVTTTTVPPLSLYFCFFPPTIPWSFTRGRSFMSQYIAHMGISRRRLKKERSITEETSRISSRSVSHLHHFLLSSLGLIVWCLLNLFWLLFWGQFRAHIIFKVIWILDWGCRSASQSNFNNKFISFQTFLN